MSELKDKIQADMIKTMKAKDKDRLGTIRMLIAAIKQREIDSQTQLDDASTLTIVQKMVKQRQESIRQFMAGHRPELAEKEQQEIGFLEVYLPDQLGKEQIKLAIKGAITETGANSMKDMGKVMAILGSQLQGQADMSQVSQWVKEQLS